MRRYSSIFVLIRLSASARVQRLHTQSGEMEGTVGIVNTAACAIKVTMQAAAECLRVMYETYCRVVHVRGMLWYKDKDTRDGRRGGERGVRCRA
jgi:hypothetical protein